MGQTQSLDQEANGNHANSNGITTRRNARRSRSLDPERSSSSESVEIHSRRSRNYDSQHRMNASEANSFRDDTTNNQYNLHRNDHVDVDFHRKRRENKNDAFILQPSISDKSTSTAGSYLPDTDIILSENSNAFSKADDNRNLLSPLQKFQSLSSRMLYGRSKTRADEGAGITHNPNAAAVDHASVAPNASISQNHNSQHNSTNYGGYDDYIDDESTNVADNIKATVEIVPDALSENQVEFNSTSQRDRDGSELVLQEFPDVLGRTDNNSEETHSNYGQNLYPLARHDDSEQELFMNYTSISVSPIESVCANAEPRRDSTVSLNVDEETDHKANSSLFEEEDTPECDVNFHPVISRDFEWMGRNVECLVLGHVARAPILQLDEHAGIDFVDMSEMVDGFCRRRSTASTFGCRRRSTASTFNGLRRSSAAFGGGMGGGHSMQGGTLASYYSSGSRQPGGTRIANEAITNGAGMSEIQSRLSRRRSSIASSCLPQNYNESDTSRRGKAGPNIVFNMLARELTGKTCFPRGIPEAQRLRIMGGDRLFNMLDKPAAGMASEVAFLAASIDAGDLGETHIIVSRLVARLTGDQLSSTANPDGLRPAIDDPTIPPTTPRFYAGGGRLGLERDAFIMAGGIQVFVRIFREKSFVGQEMSQSYDARDLSPELVSTRLAPCWNEILAALRELVYFVPSLVEDGKIADDGDFLPFLFTLLAHDSCFDGAVALIEEILSFMVQTQHNNPSVGEEDGAASVPLFPQPVGRTACPSMFFLGNFTNLYKLWRSFNCRQLAHFCRILALLVFEPEDRQLLESPAVLKSLDLLQLRRNRAARAGRDSSVDMNQAILLGDKILIRRLLKLVAIMNFAPPLRRFSPYHVMAQFPVVADTLVMLGLNELESWEEAERQERLARVLLVDESVEKFGDLDKPEPMLCELGAVADMLEGLATTLGGSGRQSQNQISHIIHVISAAQQAGVIVGRNQNRRRRSRTGGSLSNPSNRDRIGVLNGSSDSVGNASVVDLTRNGNLASVAGILTDRILLRRLYPAPGSDETSSYPEDVDTDANPRSLESRHLIKTPEDAANSLQFNAMLLGPYQVEVLFVLCTLLGGRRKYDAQDLLKQLGVVDVLEGMFQRLPWYSPQAQNGQLMTDDQSAPLMRDEPPQHNGIHGVEGCNCTPESALCVQYLRMLHNFCDRDCDNYEGRQLLLSESEKDFIKFGESDESPYRFWLASCIESYLRGSLPDEQLFVAKSGLLDHLVKEISSNRLHCAGSLQTSFDLLGELSKGNTDVVELLVDDLDEERFRKLMSVASTNLVDSNVFIRSLLLSLERLSARKSLSALHAKGSKNCMSLRGSKNCMSLRRWTNFNEASSRNYLTHSWWDTNTNSLLYDIASDDVDTAEEERESDWFPPSELMQLLGPSTGLPALATGMQEGGSFGWVFGPVGETFTQGASIPNTVDRLCWFLAANQARLLRDLLLVVDLRNINHENICCLNTAVVIAVFAHRRRQLSLLLQELRLMNDEEQESKRRALDAAKRHDEVVDTALIQAMSYLGLDSQRDTSSYVRRPSFENSSVLGGSQQIGDRSDVIRNFREVLWFWIEYYSHRGRDRLSLEFSSHIRFHEWYHVVTTLTADDGSPTSLVRAPVRLPLSPYHKAARVTDSPARGE